MRLCVQMWRKWVLKRGTVMGVIKGFTDPERGKRELEDELYESVRREVASLRRGPDGESEVVANTLGGVLQRVGGSSLQEIDHLVGELQTMRDLLETEGERVRRELAEYALLSQSSLQSTKIISESLARFGKSVAGQR